MSTERDEEKDSCELLRDLPIQTTESQYCSFAKCMKNTKTAVHKFTISITGLACAIGAILFAVGAIAFEGQSVEAVAHSPATDRSPLGNAEASTTSWDKPVFVGNPKNMGSPYVPPDSWIYPAFDRLIALGYVRSAIVAQRPWTRLECFRLLNEAREMVESANQEDDGDAASIYDALSKEFSNERALVDGETNRNAQLESIYTRVTGISGQPLTDGYHFGQTILNDFGRPFGEGFNTVDGFSGFASEGPLTAYVRGEYQHAPSIPGFRPGPAVHCNLVWFLAAATQYPYCGGQPFSVT